MTGFVSPGVVVKDALSQVQFGKGALEHVGSCRTERYTYTDIRIEPN